MVDFIGIERVQELVARRGTARFIAELRGEIEADFLRWEQFDEIAAPCHAFGVGVIELMPASDGRLYAFKYVNGHPKNTAVGLLTVTAFGVLADVETGYPLLLSELTLTTALRTAATSALAARRMARSDSRVMALIGNGAQSEFQAIAFHRPDGHPRGSAVRRRSGATEKLERNLARAAAARTCGSCAVRSTAAAVRGADIVTTVTADKCNATILTPEMIAPGMHLNAVGGDCPGKTELHRATSCAPRCTRRGRVRAAVAHRGRDPAAGAGLPGRPSSPRCCAGRKPRVARTATRSRYSTRSASRSRTSRRCAICCASIRRSAACRPDRSGAGSGGPEGPVRAPGAHRRAAPRGPLAARCRRERASRTRAPHRCAPTDVGAADRGASMGPEALRVAGLSRRSQQRELQVWISAT